MALRLFFKINLLLLLVATSPTKASSSLVKLPNKVDSVSSCSKIGLRKAVAEVRYDLINLDYQIPRESPDKHFFMLTFSGEPGGDGEGG